MERSTSLRSVRTAILLFLAVALVGCGFPSGGWPGLTGCSDCGDGGLPAGQIRMTPAQVSLRVGETIRVRAELWGSIMHFSNIEWHWNDRVVQVRPLACTEATEYDRICAAEVTGLAPGQSSVSLSAYADPRASYYPVRGHTEVVVTER